MRSAGKRDDRLFICLILCLAAVSLLTAATRSWAEEHPGWWEQARAEALRNGYRLISAAELERDLEAAGPPLLLDVRPDYEFQADHLPGAVNLEFHLGDRNRLTPDKEKSLREVLGLDLDRQVVIYCRSYQ